MKTKIIPPALVVAAFIACSSSNDDSPPGNVDTGDAGDAGTVTEGGPTTEAGTLDGAAPPPPATYAEWCTAIRNHLVIDCGKSNNEAAAEETACLASESCADQLYGADIPVQLLACFATSCTFGLEGCAARVARSGKIDPEAKQQFNFYSHRCLERAVNCNKMTPPPPAEQKLCGSYEILELGVYASMDACLNEACGNALACAPNVRPKVAPACTQAAWHWADKSPYSDL